MFLNIKVFKIDNMGSIRGRFMYITCLSERTKNLQRISDVSRSRDTVSFTMHSKFYIERQNTPIETEKILSWLKCESRI
jgi:hypothetical protein